MIGIGPLRRLSGNRLGWWLLIPLLLLIAALSAFYLAFPGTTLQSRLRLELVKNFSLQARLSEPRLLFPPALACSRVDLTLPGPAPRILPLREVRVAPLWLSLMSDAPGVRFRAALHGGTVTGTGRRNGRTVLRADQVKIQEMLPLAGAPILHGVVLESRFEGPLPLQQQGERQLELTLEQLRISGLSAYGVTDSLNLGKLELRAEGKDKALLRLTNLSLQGGVLLGNGRGTVLLGPSSAATRLNMTLELRPGAGLDPRLRDLLNLVGSDGPQGTRLLRLSGSLQQPIIR